jgi:MYXO-CTERM domain-containing protein
MRPTLRLWLFAACVTCVGAFAPPASAQIVVCVDPGHGGTDPGAQGCGLSEAAVNLSVSLALRDLLVADPALTPIMTRTTDVFISLGGRAAYANDNGAVRFASIHSNSATPAATGIETYSATNGSAKSVDQRDEIQDAMTAAWPLADRGGKTAGFYVIVNTAMPATLSELAFITNCSQDATYLGSPAKQQLAAKAHLAALRASLGLAPGDIPGPGPATGTFRGVIYEDQGVGSADLSVRLPGATVTATCAGVAPSTAAAAAPDGAWLFERPAGACTVSASLAGYVTGSRTCTVIAGQTTWCSLGLSPKPAPVPDPDPLPDVVVTPDVPKPPDVGPGPPDVVSVPDASPPEILAPPDSSAAEASDFPDISTALDVPPDLAVDAAPPKPGVFSFSDASIVAGAPDAAAVTQNGCQAAGGPAQGSWLLALLALFALRRRRLAALALAATLTACGPVPTETSTVRSALEAASVATPIGDQAALESPSALRLHAPRALTEPIDASAPLWSPDAAHLAFTTPSMDRLALVAAAGGPVRALVSAPSAGYAPVWQSPTVIAHRVPGQRTCDTPMSALDLESRPQAPPQHLTPGLWTLVRDDQVWRREGTTETRISKADDRHCCAVTSADGRFTASLGLATGLTVYDAQTRTRTALGHARSPVFSADGQHLTFVRETDDGENILSRSMHLADLTTSPPTVQALSGAPPLADHPALSPDGRTLAYDAGGRVWTATLTP